MLHFCFTFVFVTIYCDRDWARTRSKGFPTQLAFSQHVAVYSSQSCRFHTHYNFVRINEVSFLNFRSHGFKHGDTTSSDINNLLEAIVLSLKVKYRLNPFPNKPWFLRVCSSSLLKHCGKRRNCL